MAEENGKVSVSVTERGPRSKGMSMGLILSAATGAIGKWQKGLTADRRQKIRELFTVPRNDPFDPYKPNSAIAVKKISEEPIKKELEPTEAFMLDTIATNYDYCLPFDIVEWPLPLREVTQENTEELNKLPTWLRTIILLRYDRIHDYFGPRTKTFLALLADRVDWQRSVPLQIFEVDENEDEADKYTIKTNFLLNNLDLEYTAVFESKPKSPNAIHGMDLFRVAHAIVLWKLPKSARSEWAPKVVHRCANVLRTAMLTRASPAEMALAADEEKLLSSEDESDDELLFKASSWKEMIVENPEFYESIQESVEKDFCEVPKEFKKYDETVAPKLQKKREQKRLRDEAEKQKLKELRAREKWWKKNKIYSSHKARQDKQTDLINRGLYRKYSRIWFKDCPKEEIGPTTKKVHHYRQDETFHAYIAELVGSKFFKIFILTVIALNAIALALETLSVDGWKLFGGGLQYEEPTSICFEVLDNLFLSIYLTEFVVKFYAHPQKYFRNYFNRFDFAVLLTSLIKSCIDWFDLETLTNDGGFLAPLLDTLVLIRALRILRGVSINVQIQVLVKALVETLRTHVLSVLLLLLIVLYIFSIIAFYQFGRNNDDWENIFKGMLNLFAFVTMDGWTALLDDFYAQGGKQVHIGRIFCLIGILVGNFIFSNIFIAIIIMQISDATEAYRIKQALIREEAVKRKKDIVFRRQKLDMRQLLARQKISLSVDFYMLASQFQTLLRHDDVVDMKEVAFSPLWIDCMHKTSLRCLHTSNLLMNLHRMAADNLHEIYNLYSKSKQQTKPIRRARYNRCVRLKAKLTLLKNEMYRTAEYRTSELEQERLHVRLPSDTEVENSAPLAQLQHGNPLKVSSLTKP